MVGHHLHYVPVPCLQINHDRYFMVNNGVPYFLYNNATIETVKLVIKSFFKCSFATIKT